MKGYQHWWLAGGYDLEIEHFRGGKHVGVYLVVVVFCAVNNGYVYGLLARIPRETDVTY